MVIDCVFNYKVGGVRFVERYFIIYWLSCVVYYINLIVENVGKLFYVEKLISNVLKIIVFVYSYKYILNWLRNRLSWSEIIRFGEIRFVISFIVL